MKRHRHKVILSADQWSEPDIAWIAQMIWKLCVRWGDAMLFLRSMTAFKRMMCYPNLTVDRPSCIAIAVACTYTQFMALHERDGYLFLFAQACGLSKPRKGTPEQMPLSAHSWESWRSLWQAIYCKTVCETMEENDVNIWTTKAWGMVLEWVRDEMMQGDPLMFGHVYAGGMVISKRNKHALWLSKSCKLVGPKKDDFRNWREWWKSEGCGFKKNQPRNPDLIEQLMPMDLFTDSACQASMDPFLHWPNQLDGIQRLLTLLSVKPPSIQHEQKQLSVLEAEFQDWERVCRTSWHERLLTLFENVQFMKQSKCQHDDERAKEQFLQQKRLKRHLRPYPQKQLIQQVAFETLQSTHKSKSKPKSKSKSKANAKRTSCLKRVAGVKRKRASRRKVTFQCPTSTGSNKKQKQPSHDAESKGILPVLQEEDDVLFGLPLTWDAWKRMKYPDIEPLKAPMTNSTIVAPTLAPPAAAATATGSLDYVDDPFRQPVIHLTDVMECISDWNEQYDKLEWDLNAIELEI